MGGSNLSVITSRHVLSYNDNEPLFRGIVRGPYMVRLGDRLELLGVIVWTAFFLWHE